jgi:cyclin B
MHGGCSQMTQDLTKCPPANEVLVEIPGGRVLSQTPASLAAPESSPISPFDKKMAKLTGVAKLITGDKLSATGPESRKTQRICTDSHTRPKKRQAMDAADAGDPQAAVDYAEDIYEYARVTEGKWRVSPDYMSRQKDLNGRMRAILIDWLVDVHLKFKLQQETLYLTIRLIDR